MAKMDHLHVNKLEKKNHKKKKNQETTLRFLKPISNGQKMAGSWLPAGSGRW